MTRLHGAAVPVQDELVAATGPMCTPARSGTADGLFGEDTCREEGRDQTQDPLVPDSSAHPVHQGPVVDLVEARRDVRFEHPLVRPIGRCEVEDLGDRVLRPAPRPEAVRGRRKVRLEDRLEHQLERRLHNPVGGRRYPEATDLARRFRDRLLPHRGRGEAASLEIVSQRRQHRPGSGANGSRCDAVDASRACAPVMPDPVPRYDEESRVDDEVEEIIEPAAGIAPRPSMQLRLHPEYPLLGLIEVGPRCAGVHQRPPRSACSLRTRWTPSPCGRLSRPPTTAGPPPHPDGMGRRRAVPPVDRQPTGEGTFGMVPTFTLEPFDGRGAQLCPCSIATGTPQAFPVASRPATLTGRGVPRTPRAHGCALLPSPDPPGFELVGLLERLCAAGSCSYTVPSRLPDPDHLAVLARFGVVGAACHPHPHPRVRAAPSFIDPLRRASGGVLSSPHG
jgi:hypothetical protein